MRKFPDSAYENIDPAYELLDDGSVRHRKTLVVRPKFYSRLPIPFKVGDRVKVVDGNWQFPVGTFHKISHIDDMGYEQVAYIGGVPICWERLDASGESTGD